MLLTINFSIKFIDHLMNEFCTRFSSESQVGIKLLKLLPAHIISISQVDIEQLIGDLLFWESNLPHPAALKMRLRIGLSLHQQISWIVWKSDIDVYPCIHQLLVIGCTLPVTSCEAERSFSALRLTMNHQWVKRDWLHWAYYIFTKKLTSLLGK